LSALDNVVRHEECWAKTTTDGRPGVSVRDHCLNVGCVAEALLELLPNHFTYANYYPLVRPRSLPYTTSVRCRRGFSRNAWRDWYVTA
jgi:hypothetical protein